MRHLIEIQDLSVKEIDEMIALANDMMAHPDQYWDACAHQKLATLFYEPSTRTRLSFESAMLSLGGQVLGFSDAGSSSVSKGESLQDTVRIVSGYADMIAIRHPRDGAALAAALKSRVPVINAGDGGHDHPTQTLTDLTLIAREKGKMSGLTIGMCGDLRYGRTVHSLLEAMCRYPGMRFILIAPDALRLPGYVREMLEMCGQSVQETEDLDAALPELDILYMTRIQRERFTDMAMYEQVKDCYILTPERMQRARRDMTVMHPLPRVNEISPLVDDDPRAAYFRQAECGRYIRMALILKLMQERDKAHGLVPAGTVWAEHSLYPNARCITQAEHSVRWGYRPGAHQGDRARCIYCGRGVSI